MIIAALSLYSENGTIVAICGTETITCGTEMSLVQMKGLSIALELLPKAVATPGGASILGTIPSADVGIEDKPAIGGQKQDKEPRTGGWKERRINQEWKEQ